MRATTATLLAFLAVVVVACGSPDTSSTHKNQAATRGDSDRDWEKRFAEAKKRREAPTWVGEKDSYTILSVLDEIIANPVRAEENWSNRPISIAGNVGTTSIDNEGNRVVFMVGPRGFEDAHIRCQMAPNMSVSNLNKGNGVRVVGFFAGTRGQTVDFIDCVWFEEKKK